MKEPLICHNYGLIVQQSEGETFHQIEYVSCFAIPPGGA